jgi:ABC-type antimicrobial peptide transport system permease subunit
MQIYSTAILFLGLIFDIILLLFVVISVLLVYSLLMILVETKSFEFGVMRMVGLSKGGIVSLVLLQSFMFVLPSVILAFVLIVPSLMLLYAKLFDPDMGVDTTPLPSVGGII